MSDFIVLAPTLGLTDDADPVEEVLFLRDNMAALAWAVELTLHGSLDLPVDGYEQYLARLRLDLLGQPPASAAGRARHLLHARVPGPRQLDPDGPRADPGRLAVAPARHDGHPRTRRHGAATPAAQLDPRRPEPPST